MAMVTEAVCVIGPINAPMIATSTASTWVTVTVTVAGPLDGGDVDREMHCPGGGRRRGGGGARRDRRGAGAFTGGELDSEFVAHGDAHDHEPERHDDHDGKHERELDGSLAARRAPSSSCSQRSARAHTLSMTESITLLNSLLIRAAPPPAVAHATTIRPTRAAASSTSAYSVVAWPRSSPAQPGARREAARRGVQVDEQHEGEVGGHEVLRSMCGMEGHQADPPSDERAAITAGAIASRTNDGSVHTTRGNDSRTGSFRASAWSSRRRLSRASVVS